MIKKHLRKLKSKFDLFCSNRNNSFIPNINLSFVKNQKRVLLSYSTCTFQRGFNVNNARHSNALEITEIVSLLIKFDCCIDVIDCIEYNANSLLKDRQYDYIFGFGEPFKIAHINNPKAKTVFIVTENLPSFVNEKYKERVNYYYERHGIYKTGIARDGSLFRDEYLHFANFCIRLSSYKFNLKSVKEFNLAPTGLSNPFFNNPLNKDLESCKNHFVWFGSSGAIHKGLDILIDCFRDMPHLHLHICGLNKREYFLLKNIPSNIHNEGYINVRNHDFIHNIVNKCAWVIMPSCSESMSTGVMTCMLHGLIPIVSKECQFPNFKFGYQLTDYKVDYIKCQIQKCVTLETTVLKEFCVETFNFARLNYVLPAYRNSMNNILTEIFEEYDAKK